MTEAGFLVPDGTVVGSDRENEDVEPNGSLPEPSHNHDLSVDSLTKLKCAHLRFFFYGQLLQHPYMFEHLQHA